MHIPVIVDLCRTSFVTDSERNDRNKMNEAVKKNGSQSSQKTIRNLVVVESIRLLGTIFIHWKAQTS